MNTTNGNRNAGATWLALFLLATWMQAGCRNAEQKIAPTVEASPVNPLTAAIQKVEEERGEPVGRQAKVLVPRELRHYPDRKRFLAIQYAEWRKHDYRVPRDFGELAGLILRGELVEMPPAGDEYVLYGVGEQATGDYFNHYDPVLKKDIPLYSDLEEFRAELDRLTTISLDLKARRAELERAISRASKRNRKARLMLLNQARANSRQSKAVEDQIELIELNYRDPQRVQKLSSALRPITELASDFGGTSYDLGKPEQRRLMKVKMLSFIRPAARDVLLQIARDYQTTFDRPLPITSMVRSGDYQRHLHQTNRNASSSRVPPHTTGLAFDVYTYYMSAAEQQYLLSDIARLEAEGRVEALREQRDHIHVFTFVDGTPPDEALIPSARSYQRAKH